MKLRSLKELDLAGQRVFLRTDLNIPLDNKKIMQDYKIKSVLPTIDYILNKGGKIILATHLGRPATKERRYFLDENLSTKIIAEWFKIHDYALDYEPDLLKAAMKSKQHFTSILLLENLRLFQGEQENSLSFAELLATLADVYINDAFGLIHRHDTSITLLPEQFASQKRAIGFLIEKEIDELSKLKDHVKQPFLLVLGGNKMKDKIPLLEHFINAPEQQHVTTMLIGGALAHAFLVAQGYSLGSSVIDDQAVASAQQLLMQAETKKIRIKLPSDFLVENETAKEPTAYLLNQIPSDGNCLDIGPQTIKDFKQEINQAQTIFANGTMGMYENPLYAQGTREIFQALATTPAYTIIGGGDAVAAAYAFNVNEQIDFLSTGGGATLAFLGTQNPLTTFPALKVLATAN